MSQVVRSAPVPCAICETLEPHRVATRRCPECQAAVCWRCWNLDFGICVECHGDLTRAEISAKYEEPEGYSTICKTPHGWQILDLDDSDDGEDPDEW